MDHRCQYFCYWTDYTEKMMLYFYAEKRNSPTRLLRSWLLKKTYIFNPIWYFLAPQQ